MNISTDRYIEYDAKLKPCPRCGSMEQIVSGADIGEKWVWSVRCRSCPDEVNMLSTEAEAIKAWDRRPKRNEVEQDGYSTWNYDGWRSCLDRYICEVISRLESPDRTD